ncbi:hypothetical protein CPC08DRAFT_726517 [Agrocybe pediades]|nr:hypothetical protein CPC08DRAFT_726517 [Agrocybe pediades]
MNAQLAVAIPPFAAAEPPPAPIFVPLDCTDFRSPCTFHLVDQEDLNPSAKHVHHTIRVRAPTPAVRTRYQPYHSVSTRSSSGRAARRRETSSPLTSEESETGGPPAREQSIPAITAFPMTIQRPKNAVRQNLWELLSSTWDSVEYRDFRAAVTLQCKTLLDPTKSYLGQDPQKLAKLREEILEDHPILSNYESMWPLEIAIQAALKSSSAAAKTVKR